MYQNTIIVVGLAVLMLGTAFVFADIDFDSKFGSLGTGIEELDNPTDVIVSSDGNTIYVVDSENHRINVFEDDGDHDFLFGSFCSIFSIQSCNDNANGADELGDGQFDTPIGITSDQSGNYYVVDSENYRVQKFDDDGQYQLKFGSSDSGTSDYLAAPRGVAVLDATGEIFVSSMTEDSIVVFDSLGNFDYSFDSFDNDNFNNPRYLLIEDNMLYVADSGNDQIVIFQLVTISSCPSDTEEIVEGVCFVDKFGTTGSDDGEFNSPRGLAYDSQNDLLYVVDTGNDRIQSFNLVDNACPSDTEEIVEGVCFVDKFGTTGSDDGEFNSPRGLAYDSQNDLLYVADTGNDRIQVLSVGIDQLSLLPASPTDLRAFPLSPTSLMIAWNAPEVSGSSSEIIGYKIEYRVGSDAYQIITDNTKSTASNFVHNGLDSDTAYTYRVSAINSEGAGSYSSSVTKKPESTDTPSGLLAYAISPTQVKLTWHPPSNTFGQSISSYEIHRVLSTGVYDPIDTVDSDKTTYVVNGLTTDKTYSFAVSAHLGFSATDKSNTASATPRSDSVDNSQPPASSTVISKTVPAPPKLFETVESSSQIKLTWTVSDDGNSQITGYKIESKKGSGNFVTIVADTKSTAKSYKHTGLVAGTNYSYRVFAINSEGISDASNIVTAIPESVLKLSPIGKLSVNEGNTLSFAVKITDPSIGDVSYSLDPNAPFGAIINSKSGLFSWTPDSSQGAKTYTFGIVAKTPSMTDTQSVSITVNDVLTSEPKDTEPKDDTKKTDELKIPAPFVDDDKDPQYYVDRYLNEPNYKAWFDDNYPEYNSIYQAVGLNEPPSIPAPFVDGKHDPRYYVVRYTYESDYKAWFDDNYPEYDSIYQAVGLPEKKLTNYGYCGEGTKLIDGVCTIIR